MIPRDNAWEDNPPEPMTQDELLRLRAAAHHAPKRFGPIGQLVAHELLAWDDALRRLGGGTLIKKIVDQVLEEGEAIQRDHQQL